MDGPEQVKKKSIKQNLGMLEKSFLCSWSSSMPPETLLNGLLDISMEDTASQKGYWDQEFQFKHETGWRWFLHKRRDLSLC